MLKKIYWLILFIIVFTACKSEKTIKFGFLIHSATNVRWQQDIDYISKYAAEQGIEFILKDAKGDENVQLKQAKELLDEGVDVLAVVAANQNTAGGIVRDAHSVGVPVISYDRMIKNCNLDYLISFEYEKVGELLVEYIADNIDGENCVMLWGDSGDGNAIFVKNGAERAMQNHPELHVIYEAYIDGWKEAVAHQRINRVLDFSQEPVDAILACNVPLALGAVKSVNEHGVADGDILVTGQDISEEFLELMLVGKTAVTVSKPQKQLAYGVVDLVSAIVNGSEIDLSSTVNNGRIDVPAKLFTPSIVHLSNYEEVLIGNNAFTHEQLDAIRTRTGLLEN